jgi:hypothetical protein
LTYRLRWARSSRIPTSKREIAALSTTRLVATWLGGVVGRGSASLGESPDSRPADSRSAHRRRGLRVVRAPVKRLVACALSARTAWRAGMRSIG